MTRLLLFMLCLLAPAAARAEDDGNMIFRADSGLTAAEYYLASGKYTAAIGALDGVIARHPRDADAYTYKGYALAKLGQSAEAVKNLEKALALDPTHLGANKYMADAYLAKGDTPRALEQLQAMRLVCGKGECAEVRALEAAIDQAGGAAAEAGGKKADDKEKKK